MNKTQAMIELATKAEFTDIRKYSGRGMMGKNCVGITTEGTIASIAFELGRAMGKISQAAQHELEDLWVDISEARTDNMGYHKILYFPTILWEEPEE